MRSPISFEEAVAAQAAGDFETAERGYLAYPHSRNAVHNLAVLYRRTGRLAEAEAAFRAVLAAAPDLAGDRRGLAVTLLAQRRYAEAWPLYEARRLIHDSGVVAPATETPEWLGDPPAGKRLMVVAEQGLGDQLMYGRYLPLLRDRGAEVVVACDPRRLARWFEAAGFATTPLLRPGGPLPRADGWVFFGSLPGRLQPEPPPPAYHQSPAAGTGIGVVATGNAAQENDANRSLRADEAARLLRLGRNLLPEATGARDILETAEIIAGLELVITVDTAVAHLALAMGKPCWVLLTCVNLDWRWNDGRRSDWYPQARLFRQEKPGDWSGVLDAVEAALARARAEAAVGPSQEA